MSGPSGATPRSSTACGHALLGRSGEEPASAIPPGGERSEARSQARRQQRRELAFAPVVQQRGAGRRAERRGIAAGELHGAAERAGAERPRPAAAGDAHGAEPLGSQRRERDVAEERVRNGHAVEQHQRPAGGVAAQRAQRQPLRAGVGGAAVRAPELLEPGDRGKRILDPSRSGAGEYVAVELDGGIGGRGRGLPQAVTRDHDRLGIRCVRRHLRRGRLGAGQGQRQQGDAGRHRVSGAGRSGARPARRRYWSSARRWCPPRCPRRSRRARAAPSRSPCDSHSRP
jgi:hypothetical protein